MKKKNFILTIDTTEVNNIDGCIDREDRDHERFETFDEMMEYINNFVNERIKRLDLRRANIEIKPVYAKPKIIFIIDEGDYETSKIFTWEKL